MKFLVGLHLLALPLAMFVLSHQTWPQPARPLCFGLAFSDAGFLALWGALGKSWPGLRLIGVTLGMAGLSAFMTFADGIGPEESAAAGQVVVMVRSIASSGIKAVVFKMHQRILFRRVGVFQIAPARSMTSPA